MIGVSSYSDPQSSTSRFIRPVDLQQDLAALADLIELVFRDRMDASGRAALREMRYFSQLGALLNLMTALRLNELMFGISLGYVWVEQGQLVGNVSIYPANWPSAIGKAWMVANVAVHPEFRRRGIARHLMEATLDLIGKKGAHNAILQVDYDNHGAIKLYEDLGFVRERAFTQWQRSPMIPAPATPTGIAQPFITRARRRDGEELSALVQQHRPNERGGLGWLRPIHAGLFRPTLWRRVRDSFAFGHEERLITRDVNDAINALLIVERGLALNHTRIALIARSAADVGDVEALLGNTLRRYRSEGFGIEHPHDDDVISALLREYRFRSHRTVWHMRYDYR